MLRAILLTFYLMCSLPGFCQSVDIIRIANASPVAAGTTHPMFISKGTIYTAGQNAYGQLGVMNKNDAPVPVVAGNGTNYISISNNSYTTVALREDGSIWGWGFNNNGEAGVGTSAHQFTPARIGKDTNWGNISAGETHVMGIKRNGTLWAWGKNIMNATRGVQNEYGTLITGHY